MKIKRIESLAIKLLIGLFVATLIYFAIGFYSFYFLVQLLSLGNNTDFDFLAISLPLFVIGAFVFYFFDKRYLKKKTIKFKSNKVKKISKKINFQIYSKYNHIKLNIKKILPFKVDINYYRKVFKKGINFKNDVNNVQYFSFFLTHLIIFTFSLFLISFIAELFFLTILSSYLFFLLFYLFFLYVEILFLSFFISRLRSIEKKSEKILTIILFNLFHVFSSILFLILIFLVDLFITIRGTYLIDSYFFSIDFRDLCCLILYLFSFLTLALTFFLSVIFLLFRKTIQFDFFNKNLLTILTLVFGLGAGLGISSMLSGLISRNKNNNEIGERMIISYPEEDLIKKEQKIVDNHVVSSSTKTPKVVTKKIYKIGDTGPAGGIVFYIDENTNIYYEAPTFDQSNGIEWGCYETKIAGADGIVIGAGKQNTKDILAGCFERPIAASICDDLTLGGKSDWFLPSKDLLNEMYIQKSVIGGFSNYSYCSSSERSSNYVRAQYFIDDIQYLDIKGDGMQVRCARSF